MVSSASRQVSVIDETSNSNKTAEAQILIEKQLRPLTSSTGNKVDIRLVVWRTLESTDGMERNVGTNDLRDFRRCFLKRWCFTKLYRT